MKRFLVSLIGRVMSLPVLAAGGGDTVIDRQNGHFQARSAILTKPLCSVDFTYIVKSVQAAIR